MDIIAPGGTYIVSIAGTITSGIFLIIMYKYLSDKWYENILKYIHIILVLILIWTYLLQNNITFYLRERTYQKCYTITSEVYNKIISMKNYDPNRPIMFSDNIKNYDSSDYLGTGFLSKSTGIYLGEESKFYRKYLNIDVKTTYDEDILETEEFKEMPVYPEQGSIKVINDIVVIKIK